MNNNNNYKLEEGYMIKLEKVFVIYIFDRRLILIIFKNIKILIK